MPLGPNCFSCRTFKNGRIHNGKQRFKCHKCGRQFIEHPQKKLIDQATRELIDRLLLERISLAGIARALKVSDQWRHRCVNKKYAGVPRQVQVPSQTIDLRDGVPPSLKDPIHHRNNEDESTVYVVDCFVPSSEAIYKLKLKLLIAYLGSCTKPLSNPH